MTYRTTYRTPSSPRGLVSIMHFFVGLGGALAGASQLHGQVQSGDCELMDTFRTLTSREVSPGVSILWVSLPDLRCPNGLRIRADSAVVYEGTGRNELIGNVRFTTRERDLRARRANWLERDGQLLASGSVVFVDLERGTRVTGEELTYIEARQGREDQLTIWGGRPTATLPVDPAPDDPPGTTPPPYDVTANRLRFVGSSMFWGDGRVEISRNDPSTGDTLTARGDSLVFNRDEGELALRIDAELDRGEVLARGQFLTITLENNQFRSLLAREDAEIRTPEFTFSGSEVNAVLGEGGRLERLSSESGADPLTGEPLLARLAAEGLDLSGRRVEIEDAEDGTRVLRAFGGARAEALGDGFGATPAPNAEDAAALSASGAAGLPVVLTPEPQPTDTTGGGPDRDWIEGEELFAFFEPVPPQADGASAIERAASIEGGGSGGDASSAYRLIRLEARGNARALYRGALSAEGATGQEEGAVVATPGVRPSSEGALRPISYIMADMMLLYFEAGELQRLEAEGNVIGGQLEPRKTGQGVGG